jgi:hypothetical protein
MRKPRFALILFVLLVFGLTLAVPAEDVLETTYDESETQPYEAIPLLSIASPLTASGMTQAVLNDARLRSDTPFRSAVTTSNDMGQHPTAEARIALAMLCTLLC